MIGTENGPDIIGICVTFLDPSVSDSQLSINHFDLLRKDRCVTQDKSGGGLLLYYRKSLNCKRRPELEISNIETLWTEVTLTDTKPFLICTLYRPPSATSEWIDLFEEELSVAQTTGLEMIIMGDVNIDFQACSNNKWLNFVTPFTKLLQTRVCFTNAGINTYGAEIHKVRKHAIHAFPSFLFSNITFQTLCKRPFLRNNGASK